MSAVLNDEFTVYLKKQFKDLTLMYIVDIELLIHDMYLTCLYMSFKLVFRARKHVKKKHI